LTNRINVPLGSLSGRVKGVVEPPVVLDRSDALALLRVLDWVGEAGLLALTGGAMEEPDEAGLRADARRLGEHLLSALKPPGLAKGRRVLDRSTGQEGVVLAWALFDYGYWDVHVDWDEEGVSTINASALDFT
jgi:hypothetical protein